MEYTGEYIRSLHKLEVKKIIKSYISCDLQDLCIFNENRVQNQKIQNGIRPKNYRYIEQFS